MVVAVARPEADAVLSLTGAELPASVVDTLIEDAVLMAGNCLKHYGDDRQTAIIKWLAAHLVASTEGNAEIQSESVDGASQTFVRPEPGEGLRGTSFGRQALGLDYRGCLEGIGKRRPTVEVI